MLLLLLLLSHLTVPHKLCLLLHFTCLLLPLLWRQASVRV
jgi:hypothetical protein